MQKNFEKIKILKSCGSRSWGGLEMISLQSAMRFTELGHDVRFACADSSKLHARADAAGIKTIPVFTKDSKILSSVSKLKKTIGDFNPDVVHTHLSHDLWTIVPALKSSKAKLFLTKHMASAVSKKDFFHRRLYNRIHTIFAISNYIKQSVLDTCPVSDERVELLPDGVDLQKFNKTNFTNNNIKKQIGVPQDKIIIGITGRMTPGKGYEQFLAAAKIINYKYSDKVFFLAVGGASFGEDEYEKKIKSLAKELGLQNILFTGQRDDTPEMLSAMDIFAFPSHEESFGIALLEAMAMKLPAAASGNAGVLDIVVDNETGLLFEPKNAKSLAEKLIMLIENPDLRLKFGRAARKRAEEKFDFNLIINQLVEHYIK
jgi:glycosyltransferase involved in cell wall biosynthesis